MAKEKKVIEETIEETTEQAGYTISETVLQKGYKCKIDNRVIHIHAPVTSKFGQVVKDGYIEVQNGFDTTNGVPVMEKVEALTNLTDLQLKELVFAGVIILNKEQEKEFSDKFFKNV